MKTIVTAGESFRTGSEIADAVTGYGLALARIRDLDVVEIPYIAKNGTVYRAQLRIGWLIDMVVTFDDRVTDELIEADTIFGILAKTRAIERSPARRAHKGVGKLRDGTDWDEVI
jgi:hypothetical protein